MRRLWACSWSIGAGGTDRGATDIEAAIEGMTSDVNTKASWKETRVDISKKAAKSLGRSREL